MKLYYSPRSSNARKVRIVAALLGIDLELVHVDITKGAQRHPEYLAKNPMGKVPLLEDGDLLLPESAAIMAYLAEGTSLYPSEKRARADVNRWLFWGASHWSPTAAALAYENLVKPILLKQGDPDPLLVKRHEEEMSKLGKLLDDHLARREWIAAPSLTIADIAIGTTTMSAAHAKLPLDSFTHIQSWFGRIRALDAWKATEP
jgi:glutathione S-transferase